MATGLTLVIAGVSAILLLDRMDCLAGYWAPSRASTDGPCSPGGDSPGQRVRIGPLGHAHALERDLGGD